MQFSFNRFIRRTIAGISALCIVAGSCTELSSRYTFGFIPANAADTADEPLKGDFNCDGKVDITDVMELTAYIKDPSSVNPTDQGRENARAAYYYANNTYYPDYDDVQAIIEYLAGVNELGTSELKAPPVIVVPGDCDCDGYVDRNDLDTLNKYLNDIEKNAITDQGRFNARASFMYANSTYYPDYNDVQTLLEYLAGVNVLEASANVAEPLIVVPGDCDCDGYVDFDDISALNSYLTDHRSGKDKCKSIVHVCQQHLLSGFQRCADHI